MWNGYLNKKQNKMKARVKKTGEIVTLLTMPDRDKFFDTNYNPYTYDELNFNVPLDVQQDSMPSLTGMMNLLNGNRYYDGAIKLACLYVSRHPDAKSKQVADYVEEIVNRIKNL